MCFEKWLNINESNLNDLYLSTVAAFPKTTKRQYAIDEIKIKELNFTPFLGLKTLFVKGFVQNEENKHEYNPMILFKNVLYKNIRNNRKVEIRAKDGRNYAFERMDENNEIFVRCNCKDFKFRFAYYDHLDHSLYGRNIKKYQSLGIGPPANPLELPGMCKHILKIAKSLDEAGIIRS